MAKTFVEDKKINEIAARKVMSALREILSDPDRGLFLKTGFIGRIKKSIHSKEAGRTKNLRDVLAKYSA